MSPHHAAPCQTRRFTRTHVYTNMSTRRRGMGRGGVCVVDLRPRTAATCPRHQPTTMPCQGLHGAGGKGVVGGGGWAGVVVMAGGGGRQLARWGRWWWGWGGGGGGGGRSPKEERTFFLLSLLSLSQECLVKSYNGQVACLHAQNGRDQQAGRQEAEPVLSCLFSVQNAMLSCPILVQCLSCEGEKAGKCPMNLCCGNVSLQCVCGGRRGSGKGVVCVWCGKWKVAGP